MWSGHERPILEGEIEIILRITNKWSRESFRVMRVREFIVDSAHTIRNVSTSGTQSTVLASIPCLDDDGALIDILVYENKAGEFAELEIIRPDAQPLLMKSRFSSSGARAADRLTIPLPLTLHQG
ncbi:hypothetical protein [Mesorhizobium sp. CN2-181]|uniref:hypothetical protein n=1 Tax=Mesorhizobium yinganensis TaxID=3157707 RepID=UPI0032B73B8C